MSYLGQKPADALVTIDQFDPSVKAPFLGTRRNFIINGGFDIWQRGTSHSAGSYGSDDRWRISRVNSTFVNSQQTFTVGQTDVPGNPKYYSRTAVTSVAGASNYIQKLHRVEGVRSLSGRTVTLSFYAKADSALDMATEFIQHFGSGGSPSATVTGIGPTKHTLSTSWQRFTVSVTLPSISGKTLGTNNDDRLELVLWFDAGSNFDSRTGTLGQQSGNFDIANVQLEDGDVATDFEQLHVGETQKLCERYYQRWEANGNDIFMTGQFISTTVARIGLAFSTMRAEPTFSQSGVDAFLLSNASGAGSAPSTAISTESVNERGIRFTVEIPTGGVAGNATNVYLQSGEWIALDAEL